jgi:hypothetical protein
MVTVGDQVTVYHKIRDLDEVCDHGEHHLVPVYEVKKITITSVQKELVQALHYTSDGIGEVLYAEDAQGRQYRKQPHWDGPRATLWLREPSRPYERVKAAFDQYPRPVFSRDAAGRPLLLHRTKTHTRTHT